MDAEKNKGKPSKGRRNFGEEMIEYFTAEDLGYDGWHIKKHLANGKLFYPENELFVFVEKSAYEQLLEQAKKLAELIKASGDEEQHRLFMHGGFYILKDWQAYLKAKGLE